jgi:O-antigen ligase
MALNINWIKGFWTSATALLAAALGVLAGLNPALSIVSAFGLAFVVVAFSSLATGVVLFTLLTFFELLPTGGSALNFTKLVGLLLALAWLAKLSITKDAKVDFPTQHPGILSGLLVFLAWATLSYSWSEEPSEALTAVSRLALNAVLFLIVYTAIRTPRDVIWVLGAFVVGAAGAVVYGLLSGAAPSSFGDSARLSGQVENPNELAATLVAAFVLALGLMFVARRSPVLRLMAGFASGFLLFGIVLTVSRGGLVSLAVAGLAAIVLGGRWRPRILLFASACLAVTVFYFVALAPPAARQHITEQNGGTGREDVWKVGWRMVEAHPVEGVGAGNFHTSSIHYLLVQPGLLRRSDFIADTQKVAHNVYLQTWAELGAIGLALLLILVFAVLRSGFRAIRAFERLGDLQMEILARAQVVAVIGLLASLFFSSDEYKKQLWLLLAMLPAMLAIARGAVMSERNRDAGIARPEPGGHLTNSA